MATNDVKNKSVSIYIDDTAAQAALVGLQQKADAYNKTIEDTRKKQKALTDEITRAKAAGESYSKQSKELSKLNTELGKNTKGLQDNLAKQKSLQQQIDSKVGPSLKQQQQLVVKLENEFKNLGNNTDAAAKKLIELGEASKTLSGMQERLNAVKNAAKDTTPKSGIFSGAFWGSLAGNLVAQATSKIADFFKGTIDEALQAEENSARLKVTLENLGRSDAFERLSNKAVELAQRFKYLDNDDVTAVFEKLINYGKLTESQMNNLLPVIINFAAKQRISIEESSDVIVKALEGNSKGLKTYGIDVKDAKTETERLNIVMTTLKDKVEGAGDAFAETTAGKIAISKQAFKDLQEEIGNGILPALNKLMSFVNDAIKGLPMLVNDVKDFFTYGRIGITNTINEAIKSDLKQQGRVDTAAANNLIKKIQIQLDAKVVNPKTGKPYTKEDVLKDALNQINSSTDPRNKAMYQQVYLAFDSKTLGTGNKPDTNNDADTEAARKREELRKKILDENKKFLEALQKYNDEYSLVNQSEYMKELQQAFEKYQSLLKMAEETHKDELQLAGNNKAEIAAADAKYKADQLKAEEVFGHAKEEINKKYAQKELDDLKKKEDDKIKLREKQLQDQLQKGLAFVDSVAADAAKSADRKNQLRRAEQDLEISRSFGQKKYQLQQQQLDDEEQLAIEAAIKRGDSVEAVEAQFQQKREEMAKQHWQAEIEMYLGYAQQVLNAVSGFIDAKNSKENAALNRQLKANDQERLAYQRMLTNKVISQQQYLQKVAALDQDSDKKKEALEKKQFERNKKKQIVQAVINGLQAELKTLAEFGPPIPPNIEGIIASAFTVGATVAEIAAIKKTQYEGSSSSASKYGKGGALNGPAHSDGGMPVINPRTGRKEAEVEGGEVILSRKTVNKNKGLVDALLYNSLYKDGATIDPWFKNRSFKTIDFGGITRSIQNVRHYESGGTFQSKGTAADGSAPVAVVMPPGFEALPDVLSALIVQLRTPQKNYVVYQDIKDAGDTIDSIKGDATFGKK